MWCEWYVGAYYESKYDLKTVKLSGTYKYMIIHNAAWQQENNSRYFYTKVTRNEILIVLE